MSGTRFVLATLLSLSAAQAADVPRTERGSLVIEGVPEIPAAISERLNQYQNTRAAAVQGWHPSGRGLLVTTRFGETSQVHWVGTPGGSRKQLTFFDEPVAGVQPNPDPEFRTFLFSRDVGGSEFFQLYLFDLETGSSRLVTDGKSRNESARWSDDGKRFAFATTVRNGRDRDIHVASIDGGASKPVLEREGAWGVTDWSPDGTRLIVVRAVSAQENHPYVLDLASAELTALAESAEPAFHGGGLFSGDGRGVYFTSDAGSEFRQLRYRDLRSGKTTVLTADIPWNVEGLELSPDGKLLAFVTNEDGTSRLHVRRTQGFRAAPVPELPQGVVSNLNFDPEGRELALTLTTATAPGDAYSVSLSERKLTRWTESEIGGLDPEALVEPTLVRFPTFDQLDGKPRLVPAFYYKPRGRGPFPVVIEIHGGPEAQERPTFDPVTQYLVSELGIAVLCPNVRGSAGYGKTYIALDNGFKREDSVQDIGKLLDWIATQPELDAARVGVLGGSYGGYMVLSSMAHFAERLRAGVDSVGISNFVTFLESTQEYRQDLRRVEYGDERDPEMRAFLERISPTTMAHKITRPLLVVQGLNDPRVPVTESEQMVRAIRARGGTVWYVMAKDEGHGFRKKRNRDYYTAAMALFFQTFLLDGAERTANSTGR